MKTNPPAPPPQTSLRPKWLIEEWRSRQYGAFRRKHPVRKPKTKDDYLREMPAANPRGHGEEVELELAERGVCLRNGFWLREVRQREETGHQTAMLSTDYQRQMSGVAVALFARWSQENFFQARHEGRLSNCLI